MSLFEVFFAPPQVTYRPSWPEWLRWIGWAIRNPLPGLTKGLKGKPYTVESKLTWNPNGKWLTAWLSYEGKRYPWVSYRGKYIEFYFGWKPSTGSGPIIALRKANSKGY